MLKIIGTNVDGFHLKMLINKKIKLKQINNLNYKINKTLINFEIM